VLRGVTPRRLIVPAWDGKNFRIHDKILPHRRRIVPT
jgi:hypothetical protein